MSERARRKEKSEVHSQPTLGKGAIMSPAPTTSPPQFDEVVPPLDSVVTPGVLDTSQNYLALTTTQRLAFVAMEAVIDLFDGETSRFTDSSP